MRCFRFRLLHSLFAHARALERRAGRAGLAVAGCADDLMPYSTGVRVGAQVSFDACGDRRGGIPGSDERCGPHLAGVRGRERDSADLWRQRMQLQVLEQTRTPSKLPCTARRHVGGQRLIGSGTARLTRRSSPSMKRAPALERASPLQDLGGTSYRWARPGRQECQLPAEGRWEAPVLGLEFAAGRPGHCWRRRRSARQPSSSRHVSCASRSSRRWSAIDVRRSSHRRSRCRPTL